MLILIELIFRYFPIFLAIGIIAWLYFRSKKQSTQPLVTPESKPVADQYAIWQRDAEWRNYIAGFKSKEIGTAQSAFLVELLTGQSAPDRMVSSAPRPMTILSEASAQSVIIPSESPPASVFKQQLDNTLLLLYFGAFLFVAAAGLFVAFGGFSGGIRTLFVVITVAVMYGGGLWLHRQDERLRPAGVAFVAIGMAIAPLVGVAFYHYVAGGRSVGLIWFVTSAVCLAMYLYALVRLRSSFISYLFIFSFLSLFESAVAITDASVQYYVWMLILVGMVLKFSPLVKLDEELPAPAAVSAQVIIPVSLMVSAAMVTSHGVGQLSVSLLLGAIYYSLEAASDIRARPSLIPAAQILYILAVGIGCYAVFHTGTAVGVGLLVATLLQAIVVEFTSPDSEVSRNVASVSFVSAIPPLILFYPHGGLMAVSATVLIFLGNIIAVRQHRVDAFAGGALAAVALPFIIGQFAIQPHLSLSLQTAVAFIPVLGLWSMWAWFKNKHIEGDWAATASVLYVLAGIVALVPAFVAGGATLIAASLLFSVTLAIAAWYRAGNAWWAGAGVVAIVPVVREVVDLQSGNFTMAVLLALAVNIVITLSCRAEFNRWLVALLALVTPIALGEGGLGFQWSAVGYAYAYVAVMAGMIICRSLARGVYLSSSNVPIISFYRSASFSYVFGYVSAGLSALIISLSTHNSRLHSSVILIVIFISTLFLAIKVEKNRKYIAFLPWICFALLLSLFRPGLGVPAANLLVLSSSVLTVGWYTLFRQNRSYLQTDYKEVVDATLALTFAPVLLGLFYNESAIILPLMLGVAGLMTLWHNWDNTQFEREVSGAIIVAAFMWALLVYDVHNLQVYTHIVALTYAGYAYWRHVRKEYERSDVYLRAMLFVATVPLALQAIGGTAGDLYGWWLLLEQVGFMILGIVIHKRYVTMWGLYVAIGSVLFQLRHLGWAALSFLALFIIGLAVYRLMRSADSRNVPPRS